MRFGLAFAFLYPPINALFDPTSWLGYFPHFMIVLYERFIGIPLKLSDVVLLHAFGLLEVALAVWVLVGVRVRLPALAMAAILFLIVLFNLDPSSFQVVFRDVAIAFSALALAAVGGKRDGTRA